MPDDKQLSADERIKRLETVVGTLISWLHGTISTAEGTKLLEMLGENKSER